MKALPILLLNLTLSLAWAFAAGDLTARRLAEGFVLGFIALALTGRATGADVYLRKSLALAKLIAYFLKDLVAANLRVAFDIVTPHHYMRPGVVAIPLDVETDIEITLLGNLITLTPGTLALDVAADRRTMYIHSMYIKDPDELRREIKSGLEKRILELMR
ncbi:MAG: Na+/H+ antiporter subunit E [Acidobacteria bacterium]|nr:Na+/H+ antiporter subunit E [Acidobacteriota bacterium]